MVELTDFFISASLLERAV